MILLTPFQGAFAAKQHQFHSQQMKQKDQRLKSMTEILQGIKVIKIFLIHRIFHIKLLRQNQKCFYKGNILQDHNGKIC